MKKRHIITRILFILSASMGLLVSMTGVSEAQCYKVNRSSTLEPNTDRMGQDYDHFSLPYVPCGSGLCLDMRDWQCEDACNDDNECLAWTYVKPTTSTGAGHCWLKYGVPNATYNSQTTTGVRFEYNIDRMGSDYDTVATSSAAVCDDLCYFQDECMAWTWVKSNGNCWLKNSVPGTSYNTNTISGHYSWVCIH
jgi:hypothetical protein